MSLKPFKTFDEQADILLERGMCSSAGLSREELKEQIRQRLQYVNYYRLSAFWHPFLIAGNPGQNERLKKGTHWEMVWEYYMFDRRLRQLVFDAVSRIEIALRTQLAYIWAQKWNDPNPQIRHSSYKRGFSEFKKVLVRVNQYYQRSKTECALHHRNDLGIQDAKDLPVWVFVEFTTMGNLVTLLSSVFKRSLASAVSQAMGVNDVDFFIAGISLLHDMRNVCAHQGRIWNRRWLTEKGTPVMKTSRDPMWCLRWDDKQRTWTPSGGGSLLFQGCEYTASALTFCNTVLSVVAPQSHWKLRLKDLLDKTPLYHLDKGMGFASPYWRSHPLWNIR